jgi:hypothetical protein
LIRKNFSLPILLACGALTALGQQNIAPGGPTPFEVLNGSATLAGSFDPNQMLRVVLGLQPPNWAEEQQFLEQLQTPGSPNFLQFLTPDEWNARFSPSVQDEQAVVDWATSQGLRVAHRYPNRLTVSLEGTTAVIEKAFGIKINNYQLGTTTFFSNDRDPVIPATLGNIVHSVAGLNSLQVLHPANKDMVEPVFPIYSPDVPGSPVIEEGHLDATAKLPARGSGVVPSSAGPYAPSDIFSSEAYDVGALYNVSHCCNPLGNSGGSPPQSSIAIATAGLQLTSDFAGFQSAFPYLAMHWDLIAVDGTPTCCDGEGTMDFEWSTAWSNSLGSGTNTATVYMYDGANSSTAVFLDIYQKMLTDGKARVFSTSWGGVELTGWSSSVMNTADAIFANMVGAGWTLVAASGDSGATPGCGDKIAVLYPASDPYVVATGGATMSLSPGPFFNFEVAWSGGPQGCSANDGGSTGGFSAYWAAPPYQSSLSLPSRGVPDLALNADWYNTPQYYYFQGKLSGNGGTSIVAPQTAGFFAQSESYLEYLSTVIPGGKCNSHSCGPLGYGNPYLYYFGENPTYAPHYPFYDITSGCNNNDVTAFYGLPYYCTAVGWDPVTGWGSFNALQLAWAINAYQAGGGPPQVKFSGPATGAWYNTDQTVSFTATATGNGSLPPTGISGVSLAWDADPGDVASEPTPGAGNSFYTGPAFPGATTGSFDLKGAGQGCHTANVRAWDNSGVDSGDATYGPVCYDTTVPVTTDSLSGTLDGTFYISAVKVTLHATDTGSGVNATYYRVNGGAVQTYSAPFTVATLGADTVTFHSVDKAGNTETTKQATFTIKSKTTTTLASSANPSTHGSPVTFTATVKAVLSGSPSGTVTFRNGTTVLGTGTVNPTTHLAKFTTSSLPVGTFNITATYTASGNFLGSTSAVLKQTVH